MKRYLGGLVLCFMSMVFYSSPILAESEFETMEERVVSSLDEYKIVTEDKISRVSNECSVEFIVVNVKIFESRRNALSHCDDIHRFSGLREVCSVREFGDYYHEASFRFRGQGRSDSFNNIFDNIYRFLDKSRLLRKDFDIRFDNIRNSGRCY